MNAPLGLTYGAGFRFNPTAENSDELFSLCTIRYTPLLRALKLLPIVQKGEHAGILEATFYRTRSVYVEAWQSVNVQMDGVTGSASSFDARIVPGALQGRVIRLAREGVSICPLLRYPGYHTLVRNFRRPIREWSAGGKAACRGNGSKQVSEARLPRNHSLLSAPDFA